MKPAIYLVYTNVFKIDGQLFKTDCQTTDQSHSLHIYDRICQSMRDANTAISKY